MIYLDNAATTFPKPESVYRAMDQFARTSQGNPGRTSHRMARDAEHVLNEARNRLNQLFHGENADRFAFSLNCTDALNMAIKGTLRPGDHVVTTNLEHNSVSRPLEALARAGTVTLTRVLSDAGGTVDPAAIQAALTPKTRMIALTHASNVLGTIQPVAEVGAIARGRDVLFLVDVAQTAGCLPIDVQAMNVDLMAFPGHKALLGPTGTGGLYVRPGATIRPWREGGTGGDSTSPTQPAEWPFLMEGGTPNVVGVAGLLAGIQYVMERGPAAIHDHEIDLIERLRQMLDEMPGVTVYGHRDRSRRVATLSFNFDNMSSSDLGGILDSTFDIAIRPSMHCSPYIHRALGTCPEGTVRVSPGPFNTVADIDAFADALRQITG